MTARPDDAVNRRRALVSTLGSGADLAVRQGAQFVVLLVLARLVTPAEFGTVALLAVVVTVAVVIADLGMTTAILQARDLTDHDTHTAFWSTVTAGAALAVVGAVSAGPLATAFGRPELGTLAAVLSLSVIATAAGLVPTAILVKRAAFARLLVVGGTASVVSAVPAIAVAVAGHGLWALAVQMVLLPSVNSALLLLAGPYRPAAVWRRGSAERLLAAGRWVLAANVLDSAFLRLQVVVVGSVFGTAPLGQYQRADSTQQLGAEASSTVVGRVALPLFARSSHRPDLLRSGYITGIKSVTAVNAPLMALLMALATPVLVTAFGPQWAEAGPLLAILALAGLLWPLHAMALNVLYSLSRNREVFRIDVAKKLVAVAALAVGASISVQAVAWSQVVVGVAALVINGLAVQRAVGIGIQEQLRHVAPPTAVALVVGAIVSAVAHLWSPAPWVEAGALGAAGLLIYLLVAITLRVTAVTDLVRIVRRSKEANSV